MHFGSAPPAAAPCTGVVLAGGANRRFGGELKGLLEIGGRRVLDRVLDALRPVTDSQLVIANDPRAEQWAPGVRVERDLFARAASLVGIHAGLAHAATAVLVVAWDMPFVSSDLLRALRGLGEARGTHCAVVPAGQESFGAQACCAYYPSDALAVAERQIAAGELRLSAFVAALPCVVRVGADELRRFGDPHMLFMNLNDPDAVAVARRLVGGCDDARYSGSGDDGDRK